MNVKEKIKEIISGIINVPADQINEEATFLDDYGMDSLRVLEILAELENTFGIVIDPEKLEEMKNVKEVTKIVEECIVEQGNE